MPPLCRGPNLRTSMTSFAVSIGSMFVIFQNMREWLVSETRFALACRCCCKFQNQPESTCAFPRHRKIQRIAPSSFSYLLLARANDYSFRSALQTFFLAPLSISFRFWFDIEKLLCKNDLVRGNLKGIFF